ncbi:unnamed protein product [Owenia fusiformis]|uniref:Uncharacterized protein n=1 Tax=Owenia fusiformis TaxID=6347 RepID=A0A8S4NZH8_OWEFU|nr:unnamed protein product [Owenia fusiformis]
MVRLYTCMLLVLCILTVPTCTNAQDSGTPCDDCSNQPDHYRCYIGCTAFLECRGGQTTRVTCDTDDVVDIRSMRCEDPYYACPPCGDDYCDEYDTMDDKVDIETFYIN